MKISLTDEHAGVCRYFMFLALMQRTKGTVRSGII